jgi:hypothetical protein
LVKHLFNAVSDADFLRIYGKNIYIGNQKLNDAQVKELTNGARTLIRMEVWNVMMNQLKIAARRKMYEKSTSYNDMYFGKAMLYNIDVMEEKVRKLSQM